MQEIQADVILLDAQVFTPLILEAFENATVGRVPTHCWPHSPPIRESLRRSAVGWLGLLDTHRCARRL